MQRILLNRRSPAITALHPTTKLKRTQAFKSRAGRAVARTVLYFRPGQAAASAGFQNGGRAAQYHSLQRFHYYHWRDRQTGVGFLATVVGVPVLYVVESVGRPSPRDILG